MREAKLEKRCLSMIWIDYRKTYDLTPHSWIIEMMSIVKVAGNMRTHQGEYGKMEDDVNIKWEKPG